MENFSGPVPNPDPTAGTWKYDPSGTRIKTPKGYGELSDAVLEAADALLGDDDSTNEAHAAAMCRALYDLNKIEGGFCCQSLVYTYPEGPSGEYGEQFMTTATKVSDSEPSTLEFEYEDGPGAGTTF